MTNLHKLFVILSFFALPLSDFTRAEASPADHDVPLGVNPVAVWHEEATWTSTDPDVIDWTNELITLNPGAMLIINGQTATLISPTNTRLVRPSDPMPSGVTFTTVRN
jgi:hypothetical protein